MSAQRQRVVKILISVLKLIINNIERKRERLKKERKINYYYQYHGVQLVHRTVRCELLLPWLHMLNQVKKFQYEIDYYNGMLGNLFMKGISNEMNNNTTNN